MFQAFDAVLVDAPCSCDGNIRKDRDALAHWRRNGDTTKRTTHPDA